MDTSRSPSAGVWPEVERGSMMVCSSVSNTYMCSSYQPIASWIIRCTTSRVVLDGIATRRHTVGVTPSRSMRRISEAGSGGSTARKTGLPQHFLYLVPEPHQQGELRSGGHSNPVWPVSCSHPV